MIGLISCNLQMPPIWVQTQWTRQMIKKLGHLSSYTLMQVKRRDIWWCWMNSIFNERFWAFVMVSVYKDGRNLTVTNVIGRRTFDSTDPITDSWKTSSVEILILKSIFLSCTMVCDWSQVVFCIKVIEHWKKLRSDFWVIVCSTESVFAPVVNQWFLKCFPDFLQLIPTFFHFQYQIHLATRSFQLITKSSTS